jgi:hypothetical protein
MPLDPNGWRPSSSRSENPKGLKVEFLCADVRNRESHPAEHKHPREET